MDTLEYKGYSIEIEQDENPISPREDPDACFGHLIAWHRRYDLSDSDQNFSIDEFKSFMKHTDGVFLPVYMYDHSGISLSCDYTYPYNDRWDAGQLGFIYITNKEIREKFSAKRVTKKLAEKAENILRGEIRDFSAYVEGDIYGWWVVDENGDLIDSRFGYFEYDYDYMIKEAQGAIDHHLLTKEKSVV